MTLDSLEVLQYELGKYDFDGFMPITLDRVRSFEGDRWAIRRSGFCLNKKPFEAGLFCFFQEPLPSNRDEQFYEDYRFKTAKEALDFWETNRAKIIATQAETIHFYDTYIAGNK